MSLKSTLAPALYFAGALTFGTLGAIDATQTVKRFGEYFFMKQASEGVILDTKKEAQYQAFMARDDVCWHGGKTALEFLLTGALVAMGIKKSRED